MGLSATKDWTQEDSLVVPRALPHERGARAHMYAGGIEFLGYGNEN